MSDICYVVYYEITCNEIEVAIKQDFGGSMFWLHLQKKGGGALPRYVCVGIQALQIRCSNIERALIAEKKKTPNNLVKKCKENSR